jgi:hypothetical protein
MDWKLFATFAAPLISGFIIFLLNKHFHNKPRLIAYYGHVLAHTIANNKCSVYLLLSPVEPNKGSLDRRLGNQFPILIKHGDTIWIYGLSLDGNTKLTKSNASELYSKLDFTENLMPLQEISEDIHSNGAHRFTMYVGTHAIVVRNSSRLSAKNVRLGHKTLQNYSIYPSTQYEIVNLPNGGWEIIFPILVPGDQITISYLYFAPLTYAEINTHVKSDEGLAKVIDVIPTPSLAVWQKVILCILLFVGLSTLVYISIIVLNWFCTLSAP